ncbi:MAG: maleylacetoacetate isomerase [Gammaproteobacteria bacterium 39-13]|nr:maleylacetoacetate isomerase [Gammaproteobacteria bacterium]OJV87932.1 MAG: maleylacetoacetate isomerase [Gammaproteobacteria bacterium 39-13]
MFKLYDYCRSSACFRVRIALNLKQLPYEQVFVDLLKEGGQQLTAKYALVNPQKLVPTLFDEANNITLTQSMAIIEYLEENYPQIALLPENKVERAHVRSLANMIACDIHPLNNLRVLKYLKHDLHLSEELKNQWYHHWIREGFSAVEKVLKRNDKTTSFCFGEQPTLADICLVPQMYNAQRFKVKIEDFPVISRINENCLKLPAFINALPEKQPDAMNS